MKVITIGRHDSNDVVIGNDDKVSRHHLQIIQNGDGNFRLSDFGGTNGTFINDVPVTGETLLNESDIIRIGNTTLPWNNYFREEIPAQTAMSGNLKDVIAQKIINGCQQWTSEELQYQKNYPHEIESVLKKLQRTVVQNNNYCDGIITAPSFLGFNQRQVIIEQTEKAGLKCRRILNATTAIAMAYYLDRKFEGTDIKVAVLNLNNEHFDIAVFEIGDGVYETKSISGSIHNFGYNIDNQTAVNRITELSKKALEIAEYKKTDKVLLTGNLVRSTVIQDTVMRIFGKLPELVSENLIAEGAAIQAGILNGQVKDVLPLEAIPVSVGIETAGGVMTKIIEANSSIPIRKSETFTTSEDNQPSVEVHILQGENEKVTDNVTVGRFHLDGIPPAAKGVPQIEVLFDIDANGRLRISAKDKGTGKKMSITISGNTKK